MHPHGSKRRQNVADLVKAAKSGNQRELYQGILEDLTATLANGCEAYTKPGIVKQIIAVQEKIESLPKEKKDSPLAKAKNGS